MEQRRNWIGLGVIGIGLLLLGFMLGSRGSGPAWQAYAPAAPPAYQQAPSAPQAPGWRQERREWRGEAPGGFMPRGGYAREDGPRHGGRFGMMFFAPFFFLGGLLKLALLAFLVLAALRFFRRDGRRPWGGPPWGHGEHREDDRPRDAGTQDRPGPEDPTSYTGGTTRL